MKTYLETLSQIALTLAATSALAFEGRIQVVTTRGSETNALLYTVGTNCLRIEVASSSASPAGWPNPVDLVEPNSSMLTLLFPHNRSFVRLQPATAVGAPVPGMALATGGVPAGSGPHAASTSIGGLPPMPAAAAVPGGTPPGNGQFRPNGIGPGAAGMPAMPMMPPMAAEKIEMLATGDKTNLLGMACERYELKQRGETMEIWATEALLPFRPYTQSQPHRFGPRRLEEQFAELLTARKLFPLLVTCRYPGSAERVCLEVTSITPAAISDPDGKLFEPPPNYREVEPLPF